MVRRKEGLAVKKKTRRRVPELFGKRRRLSLSCGTVAGGVEDHCLATIEGKLLEGT
jgi:hypothetical protein